MASGEFSCDLLVEFSDSQFTKGTSTKLDFFSKHFSVHSRFEYPPTYLPTPIYTPQKSDSEITNLSKHRPHDTLIPKAQASMANPEISKKQLALQKRLKKEYEKLVSSGFVDDR